MINTYYIQKNVAYATVILSYSGAAIHKKYDTMFQHTGNYIYNRKGQLCQAMNAKQQLFHKQSPLIGKLMLMQGAIKQYSPPVYQDHVI